MKISVLGSGSEGNAIYLEVSGVPFLIDAGFSAKALICRFESIGVDPSLLRAIIVTHEHSDHIKGVGILSRKFNLPIYITPESYHASKSYLGKIAEGNVCLIEGEFEIDSVRFIPFDVSHDAIRTVGFRIEGANGKSMAISTDLGCCNQEVVGHFSNVDLVVLEANYDFDMLQNCSYPYVLKQRIDSDSGHLSNKDSGKLIGDIYHPNLKKVYLAHVSKNSNSYERAFQTVTEELIARGFCVDVQVTHQDIPTKIFTI